MAKFRVSVLLEVSDEATVDDVHNFMYDLEWVGGCRDPETDPMFGSAEVIEVKVTRGRSGEGMRRYWEGLK